MKKLKKLPRLTSDAQAENWLMRSDMTEYDWSTAIPAKQFWAQVEDQRKDKTISLRLPAPMQAAVRDISQKMNTPVQRYIRQAIEEKLARDASLKIMRAVKSSGSRPQKIVRTKTKLQPAAA